MSSRLASNNIYSVLHLEKPDNKLMSTNTTERIRDIRRILRPLREVWLKVGLEKLESHEGVAVKALFNSSATGLFMDTTFAKEKGFKMEKLKKLLLVRNVDRTANAEGAIMHQVEYNMFFKGHIERARINVYNLGKIELILGIPWLAAYNPEIDWEKGEVKIMHCPPIYGKKKQEGKEKKVRKTEKNEDEEVLRELVPRRLWK